MKVLLNHFLFFVALVFNLDAPIISNHTCLEIDLKKKEFRVEYEDLVYIDNPVMNENVSEFIKKIDAKDVTINPANGMTLKSAKFDKDDNEWSLSLKGTFDNLDVALEYMGIKIEENRIIYREQSEEKIEKSNGKTIVDAVIWKKDAKKIKLRIDRRQDTEWNKSIEKNQGKMRSLSKFK